MYIAPEGIPRNKDGSISLPKSAYKPGRAVRERTALIKKDFEIGHQNLNKSFREFSYRTVKQYRNDCRDAFNTYVPPKSKDPQHAWQANTTRPVTRNKLISIGAHILSALMVPGVVAQNSKQERDLQAERVMKDLMTFVRQNSSYEQDFINVVFKALVSPAAIVHVDWYEIMRTIKEKQVDGSYNRKDVLDEVLSGFQMNVRSVDEILIENPYEKSIYKQRFLFDVKKISYDSFINRFRNNDKADFVAPGVKHLYIEEDDTFYEAHDDHLHDNQVELATYYNYAADLELIYANGVLMTDPEEPIRQYRHIYPYAKGGYEPINEGEFFYYKSAADKLGPDQEVVDKLYNMVLDGAFLNTISPVVTYGEEEVDSSIFIPGSIHSFSDPDSKVDTIGPSSDINSGMAALNNVERSLNESSVDPQISGMGTPGEQTARETDLIQQNAMQAMGLFTRMLSIFVQDVGELMKDLIIQHMTVADVKELTDAGVQLDFKSFVISDEDTGQKRRIEFVAEELPQTSADMLEASFDLLEEEGLESDQRLHKVNAERFRNLKYYIRITAENIRRENKAMEKALNLEAYDRMIQNPFLDQQEVSKDLVEVFKPGQSSRYMNKRPARPAMPGGQANVNDNMASQMTGNNNMSSAITRG